MRMKKKIACRSIIFFVLIGVLLLSCEKDKAVPLPILELDRNAVEIQEGFTATIEVISGNGNYTVSETALVEVEISGNLITLSATENYGEEQLFVTDGAGKKAALTVKVIPAILGVDDPRFHWDALIALEQANGWATTILANKVAITNVEEKKQYALSWNGEFSVGVKPKAVLRIIDEEGQQEIALSKLEILSIDRSKNLCTVVFYKEKRKGELIFLLP